MSTYEFKSLNVYDLMNLAEAKAILGKLSPDEHTTWRTIERNYSKIFFTPLHEVHKLDPEFVLLSLYENNIQDKNLDEDSELNDLLTRLNKLTNPDFDAAFEADEEEYNRQAVKEEENKQAKKAAKKAAKVRKNSKPECLPKSGGINLEYLAQDEKNES
jgi:hypothetical protein